MTNRSTESVKDDFKSLAKCIVEFKKEILISGPVPLPTMNSEQFSRLLAINLWLIKWTSEEGICFTDNFDLFWKKPYLFHKDGKTLNTLGSVVLTNNITSNITTLIDL